MKSFRQLNTRTGVFQAKCLNVPSCDFCGSTANHEILQDSNRIEFPSGKALMCERCYGTFIRAHKVNVFVSSEMLPLPSPMGFENKRSAKGVNVSSSKTAIVDVASQRRLKGLLEGL